MAARLWGYLLLPMGLFMALYHIRTDPRLLTLVSFSVAIAGLLLVVDPYRLRWFVVLFLVAPAGLGVLGIVLTRGHLFSSLTWIAAAILPLREVFAEARQRQISPNT